MSGDTAKSAIAQAIHVLYGDEYREERERNEDLNNVILWAGKYNTLLTSLEHALRAEPNNTQHLQLQEYLQRQLQHVANRAHELLVAWEQKHEEAAK